MAEAALGTQDRPGVRPSASAWQVTAVVIGNALEFYDFLTFSFFAVQIGAAFFPSHDPSASLLASLATFGAGFLTRPLGAFVIGRMGDRIGRKPAMLLSFSLMGGAITGLALTPSYAMIGIAAPLLAIAFRMIQGFALGGEVGPSTAFLIEAAPPHRRGLYVSLQFVGQSVAVLFAGLIGVALAHFLTPQALADWGWRIALLIGAIIVPFGLMLRQRLVETINLEETLLVEPPAAEMRRTSSQTRLIILALLMMASLTIATYVMNHLTTYAAATLHMASTVAFGATVVSGLAGVIISPIGGWLADKYGRKPVMIIPAALTLALTLPCFYAISHFRTPLALLGATALLKGVNSLISAAMLISIAESLPKRVRSGAIALIYAVAISTFGGSTQFMVAWLTVITGSPMTPAWYMTAAVAIGLAAMMGMRETRPR
ncbi:MAG: MFS transporter [Caulobacterales bacterium]